MQTSVDSAPVSPTDATEKEEALAYHYTREAIMRALPPYATSILSELTYKPTIWFTSNEFWEPQAGHLGMGVDKFKLSLSEYQPSARRKQPLDMEEMREKGGGLVRFRHGPKRTGARIAT